MSRASAADQVFGQKVAAARESRGFSQTLLARSTSVGYQPTISKIENGERPATVSEAQSIAAALGVPLGDLLDGGYQVPPECPGCVQTRQKVLAAIGVAPAAQVMPSAREMAYFDALFGVRQRGGSA